MEKQHIISIKKYHNLKIIDQGFSLIEVSLSMVLLSSAMLFMWQTSKVENEIYLSREHATVACQYLSAFDAFLSKKQKNHQKEEIKLEVLQQYLPNKYHDSIFSRNINFYTTEKGVGLIVLKKDHNQKESNTRRSFLGFRTAHMKNGYIYSYDEHIKVKSTEFPPIPEQDEIEVMAIIPKDTSYIKRCIINIDGEDGSE